MKMQPKRTGQRPRRQQLPAHQFIGPRKSIYGTRKRSVLLLYADRSSRSRPKTGHMPWVGDWKTIFGQSGWPTYQNICSKSKLGLSESVQNILNPLNMFYHGFWDGYLLIQMSIPALVDRCFYRVTRAGFTTNLL